MPKNEILGILPQGSIVLNGAKPLGHSNRREIARIDIAHQSGQL
jgi:hypothetical protein